MNKFFEKIVIAITTIFIVCIVEFLIAWPFMLLWNWLMPVIFGFCKIGFWQSLGLLILSGMIFRSSSNSSSK